MNTAKLVDYIKQHGHEAWVNGAGNIEAIEVFTKRSNGLVETHEELVELAPTLKAVRNWLGY